MDAKRATLELHWAKLRDARDRETHRRWTDQRYIAGRIPELIKRVAYSAVYHALRDGRLVRPPSCSRCGALPKYRPGQERVGRQTWNGNSIEAHHPDYAEPLCVLWLCRTCHRREHAAMSKENKHESDSVRPGVEAEALAP